MITPDAAIDRHPVVIGRARLADARVRQDAITAPEPAVGTPFQSIEHIMLSFCVPAVELDDGLAVGPVIAIAVGNEEQVWRGTHPHAAEAKLDPGEIGSVVVKDCPAIEPAVVIGVFKDQDPVLAPRASQPDRVRIVLDDPEPSFRIDGHGDRLNDVGLGGEQGERETLGQRDPLDRFLCRERNRGAQ